MRETSAQAFDSVLVAGFSLMGSVYGLVAACGYYYFGDGAAEIITDSLARDSPFAGRSLLLPGLTIDRIVAFCILLKAYTTYPCLVMVLQVLLAAPPPALSRNAQPDLQIIPCA